MAQSVKASPVSRIKPTGRKPGRPAAARTVVASEAPTHRTPARATKAVAATPKASKTTKAPVRAPAVAPALKVSKDELRAQVAKLEQLVATFRAKSRETGKAAKAAAARISELEAQVARLEKQAAAAAAPASPRPVKSSKSSRAGREIDPGDGVPPGVAVLEPAPLDDEAEIALEHLEEHLGHG